MKQVKYGFLLCALSKNPGVVLVSKLCPVLLLVYCGRTCGTPVWKWLPEPIDITTRISPPTLCSFGLCRLDYEWKCRLDYVKLCVTADRPIPVLRKHIY